METTNRPISSTIETASSNSLWSLIIIFCSIFCLTTLTYTYIFKNKETYFLCLNKVVNKVFLTFVFLQISSHKINFECVFFCNVLHASIFLSYCFVVVFFPFSRIRYIWIICFFVLQWNLASICVWWLKETKRFCNYGSNE